jgi:hypothetical protein
VKDLRAVKALSTAGMSETTAKIICRILVERHGDKMARFTTAIMQVFNKVKVQTFSNVKALNALLGQVYTAFTLSVTKCIRLSCRKTIVAPFGFALHSVADSQFSTLPSGYMQDAGSKLAIISQSKAPRNALNESKTESLFLRHQAVVAGTSGQAPCTAPRPCSSVVQEGQAGSIEASATTARSGWLPSPPLLHPHPPPSSPQHQPPLLRAVYSVAGREAA